MGTRARFTRAQQQRRQHTRAWWAVELEHSARRNEEGEEKTIPTTPRKVVNQSHIFFRKEFRNKAQLNKYMNTSEVSINDINDELEALGEERQKNKNAVIVDR